MAEFRMRFRQALINFPTPYIMLALIPGMFAVCYILIYAYVECSQLMVSEDNIIEWLTFVFSVLLAIFSAVLLVRSFRERLWFHALFYFFLMFGAIFLAGEEISWGQRLIGLETPEIIAENSVQDETNLHNLLEGATRLNLNIIFAFPILVYGAALPILSKEGRIPIPSLALVPSFILIFLGLHNYPIPNIFGTQQEFAEITLPLALVLVTLWEWQKKHGRVISFRLRYLALTGIIWLIAVPTASVIAGGICENQWCSGISARFPEVVQHLRTESDASSAFLSVAPTDVHRDIFDRCRLAPAYPTVFITELDGELIYAYGREKANEAIDDIFANHDNFFTVFVNDTLYDPNGEVRSHLLEQAFPIEQTFVGGLEIIHYGYAEDIPLQASNEIFGDEIELVNYGYSDQVFNPGDIIKVVLELQAIVPLDTDYTIGVQVMNSDGQLVAQNDSPPRMNNAPTSTWTEGDIVRGQRAIVLPDNLPTGEYQLQLVFYDADGRLPVGSQDALLLGIITVE